MDTEPFKSCLDKQKQIKNLFTFCKSAEEIYQKLIEIGKSLPAMDETCKIEKHIVQGCQSTLYLTTRLENDKLFFCASSEALISAGLAFLLVAVYSDETPETVLKCPPLFIQDIGLNTALTPGRSNGLASMYLRMKQEALFILSKNISNLL